MSEQVIKKALTTFRAGLNCSQAVLTAYSEKLKFDENLALNVACGFGGGMGRLQQTCGAVTGSYMVLGIHNSKLYSDNKERKEATYSMIQKFSESFNKIHGTTECQSLLKVDLRTDDGYRNAIENNLFGTVCEQCISDSISIIDKLIEE